MIIDKILDRKDGEPYKPESFYRGILDYGAIGHDITRAMDYGTESDVKKALCSYVIENEYNPNICKYINKQNWL
jgi:hypothetical protein